MEYYHVILFLLAIAIAISVLAPKVKIPYPVLLMVAGIAVGFIPSFHYVPIDPDVVFLLFLPPLLYDAAVNMPFKDFKANFGTISMMAVTLVFISMIAIAIVARFLIPDISWPVAFVIGAILSPPDAIATSGITKSLSLSHRTNTILEGESLINDASALTAYRIALGVATGGIFSAWEAGLEFVVTILGGCLIGAIMAFLFGYTVSRVKLESTAIVSLNLMLPFVAYQFAEELNVSGVLAVVFMGVLIAGRVHKNKLLSEVTRGQSRSVWSIIIYLLSGLVFILIGLELPQVLREIPPSSVIPLV
uniref:cation:proton antiporter n=1 Tax=Dysgonomonas gadei TaxID=156974 RepID=UPI003AF08AA8